MAKVSGRVQFYAPDNNGKRRIFSLKVHSEAEEINALARMNIQAGFYKHNENIQSSKKIINEHYLQKTTNTDFFKKLDKFLGL